MLTGTHVRDRSREHARMNSRSGTPFWLPRRRALRARQACTRLAARRTYSVETSRTAHSADRSCSPQSRMRRTTRCCTGAACGPRTFGRYESRAHQSRGLVKYSGRPVWVAQTHSMCEMASSRIAPCGTRKRVASRRISFTVSSSTPRIA